MNEVRKVIAVFDSLSFVPHKNEIAFPSVRIWIRGANDFVTRGLEQSFPERGTIYLHVSACENHRPVRNQVGLFQCIASAGKSAEWRVSSTLRQLAKVIEFPIWEKQPDPLAFWEWLVGFKDATPCNVLLGQGIIYVRRGKNELIGPFSSLSDGKLAFREQASLFEGVEILSVEIAGRPYGFVDTESLPKGKPLFLDPREAIHRRLKLLSKTNQLDWLSRARVQELSTALASVTVVDGSEWVTENLPRALELLVSSGKLDENVTEELLQIKGLEETLHIAWSKKHEREIKEGEKEIDALKSIANGIKQTTEGLKSEAELLKREKNDLETNITALQSRIEEAKTQARQVFEIELKRLADSPASLAVLGAWIGGRDKPANASQPLITARHAVSQLQQVSDLKAALFNNFKACSLSPAVATELTAVCIAALAAGQPISFKSLLADILADAVVSALGQPVAVWADVPAGLLDPVDWNGLIPHDQRGCPIVLQNANRSDMALVLGALRPTLLRRALGHEVSDRVILLTLVSNGEMEVPSDFPFGPMIDDRVLRFHQARSTSHFIGFTDFAKHLPGVVPISTEEFSEIGDPMRELPLFAMSAHENVFRRAYAALRGTCEDQGLLSRLFFKYWCLARCLPEDVRTVLEAYKDSWAKDTTLVELRETLDHNG